ncbi:hypothetical protein BD324DRAFT_579500 [Kockovaella imperatae]|uniref:DUF221-domain-containing protein n=1 Tax=Kockovaella imperatae TaxID=4999 RepID=A0A1Y1UGR6_9TREE|nr:hypothetical protein BD324DRAFT_579500 [Kockovaella imperatae]ORX37159.1 hypothetical protein BD324DRAFT_579500 [Kockovaella imperatae]
MSATGKNVNASTTPAFVSALVVAGITVGGFSLVWLILHNRKSLRRVFQPRAEIAPESKRPPELPGNPLSFWKTIWSLPDKEIMVANGLDAYLFVRYLKVFGLQMMGPYVILSIAICVPMSAIAPNNGLDGLNQMSFGNVPSTSHAQLRHIGHFLVAVVLMSWTLYLLYREYNHFIDVRREWLSSAQHLSLARTRNVAITNLPDSVNSESGLKELAGVVARLTGSAAPRPSNVTDGTVHNALDESGGVRNIWLSKKLDDLEQVWQDRDDECSRLEGGVGKLQKLAAKNQRKGKTPEAKGTYDSEKSNAVIDRFVLPKKQPTWRQGPLGLIGKKMDLNSSPAFIAAHNVQLESMRAEAGNLPSGNTAFIRFSSQAEAHEFARLVSSTDKKHRSIRSSIEVIPEDVRWNALAISPMQRRLRTAISWALTIFLIIIWAIPVAFVGIVSNVDTLCETVSWLAWICQIPKPALGIIKGVLPPALLAVLFMLLPIVLRAWVGMQGEIRNSDVELKLFSRFWLFQVIHGFLIVTLASGLVGALQNIGSEVQKLPTLLATNLPNANIFFLTFILTATFTTAAKAYSRAIPYVMFLLKGILAGNTPRKVYIKQHKMDQFPWAVVWPPICLIICITIVYSVIQPLMTVLTFVAFLMFFAAYKYLLYWTTDQPDSLETGGLFYIKALRTVFVALYLEGICLAGLLFLSSNQDGGRSKAGLAGGVIMVFMIIVTALLQFYIDWFKFKKSKLVYTNSGAYENASGKGAVDRVNTSTSEEHSLAGPELGNTSGFHEQAFDHPALWKKQPTVWIADDPLGVGKFESARINEASVESSTEFATMDEKANIMVQRAPPDEAWYGGFTRA